MRPRYALSSYDQNCCLRPSWFMWAALLYLSRAVTLPLVIGVSSMAGMTSQSHALYEGLFDAPTLVPSVLAALVLFALLRRAPGASRTVRWLWTHGQWLLALAALIDCGLTLFDSPVRHGEFSEEAGGPLLAAALDLYFVAYLLFARRARDTFADFPELQAEESAQR